MRDSSSFQCANQKLFNSLPPEVLLKISIGDFKIQLDDFLRQIPDEPKSPGMTPTCLTPEARPTNSLVYWIPLFKRTGRTKRTQGIVQWKQSFD